MTDQPRAKESGPGNKAKAVESDGTTAPAGSPTSADAGGSASGEDSTSKALTAEEQMALYEKDLKENDWGHQPC